MANEAEQTNFFSDLTVAADSHNIGAEGKSIFESASDIVTKGIPVTGLSVYNSFVNTAVEVANFFGADVDLNNPIEQLQNYDEDLLRYYEERAEGVEVAGLVVGSLIPGLAAAKAVNLAAQSGRFGTNIARATGLLSRDATKVEAALQEFNLGKQGLYGQIQRDKWIAIAGGFAEQGLQAAAYEAATLATMKANPTISKDGLQDILSHMFWGTLVGGGIGGVLEGIAIRGVINKALVTKDLEERTFDMATRLGLGDFIAGDKVASLLRSVDEIPEPTTATAAQKLSRTASQAERDAWKILKEISPEADENLGAAFLTTLKEMKQKLQLSNDDMYEYFARLQRIGRVNEFSHLSSEDVVYLHTLGHKQIPQSLDDIVSKVPKDEGGVQSIAVVVKDKTSPIQIARADEELVSEAGKRFPKYTNKGDAFYQGNDIYIDEHLTPHLNPHSERLVRVPRPGESRILNKAEEKAFRETGKLPEGSDDLLGAPLYFNLLDGRVTSKATAVFGDLGPIENLKELLTHDAKGAVTGVKNGTFVSPQYVASGFNYLDSSSLDSNARYVWAALRKIQKGDIINFDDIPLLEQVHRQGKSNYNDFLTSLGIKLRDAEGKVGDFPHQTSLLEKHIWEQKDRVIASLLASNKNLSVDEIAIKANVPRSYVESGLQAEKFSEIMRPIEDSLKTNTIKLEYNIGDVAVQEGNILRGMLDVDYRIQLAQQEARNASVNFFGDTWERFIIPATADEAEITGAGSRFLSFSNAGYGEVAQKVETTGAAVSKLTQERWSYISDRLNNEIVALKEDAEAAAELAVLTNVGRRISRQYVFLPSDLAAAAKVPEDTIVLRESIKRDAKGNAIEWNKDYIPMEGNWIHGKKFRKEASVDLSGPTPKINTGGTSGVGAYTYYTPNPKVAAFLRTSTELNDARLVHHNNWLSAQGIARSYDLNTVYFPPIDTKQYKYVAIVREKEGKSFATSDAAAIVSDTAEGLRAKVEQLGPEWRVNFKDTSREYHEALGDYDYALNLVESQVDSTLRKKGVLSDVFPNVRGEQVLNEYFQWHKNQEVRLIRNYVELGNAQFFAELRALGRKFVEIETSTTGPAGIFKRQISDPFNQYIKTALNVSEKQEYRLWSESQDKLEAFGATAFRTAKELLGQASKGLISYEDAARLTQTYGLGNPYERAFNSLQAFREANRLPLTPALSTFVQKANSVLAATTIRLDMFQTLINIVSTPVLLTAEFASVKNNKALRELLTTELPDGSARIVPSYTKVLFNSVANFFGADKDALITRYRDLGVVRKLSSDYHEMLGNLTIAGSETVKKLEQMGEKAVELGVKISRADWAEEFVRFVAADSGRQLFEALGVTGRQLDDNIRTFVNRVHGNYIAAQRPIAFQGPIGQAVGLFQTYQFNLLQQVFRLVENREKLPQAMLFGIQGTLFGMQGIPGFQAINTHIVGNAAGNPEHKDFYSQIPTLFDKKLGNWLLYGSVSNFLGTGLYSRGDINPRQITVLPVNPIDYPAVSGGIRFVSNILDIAKRGADGGRLSDTILQGLEHNGISRPLTGLAQVVQGYTTTSKGSLISAANDWDTLANAARFAGARPLDEAIAMDALYRMTAYKAKDRKRVAQLGEAVKTQLIGRSGEDLDPDKMLDFAAKYAAAGGRIENFSRTMINWTRDANQSTANKVFRQLKDPVARNMMKIMGGEQLPDYTNAPSLEGPDVQ